MALCVFVQWTKAVYDAKTRDEIKQAADGKYPTDPHRILSQDTAGDFVPTMGKREKIKWNYLI
jgi:hypothetical protein